MDEFDKKIDEILNEGILQRAKQRLKNVGRTFSHPYKRVFGDDDLRLTASMSSNKGYKRIGMLADIMKDAVKDLQKLDVLKKDYDASEIAQEIADMVMKSKYFNPEGLLSKFGKIYGDKENKLIDRENRLIDRENALRRKEDFIKSRKI